MTAYPILVDRFDDEHPSDIVICAECLIETKWVPETGDPEGLGGSCDWCDGRLFFKYLEADRCPNCRELGFYSHLPTKGCCSRVCMLQKEWADSLSLSHG